MKIEYFRERVEPAPQVGDPYTLRDTDPDRARVCDTAAEVLECAHGARSWEISRACANKPTAGYMVREYPTG